MTEGVKEFIYTFNECYPFERYILKNPKQINYLFDDVLLTELFIPSTEIKPVVDEETSKFLFHTSVMLDEIYIKLKCGETEIRLAYLDFANHIAQEIEDTIKQDFGLQAWQDLYVETEDNSYLKEALKTQRERITEKYGECKIKDNFHITDTIELLKEL